MSESQKSRRKNGFLSAQMMAMLLASASPCFAAPSQGVTALCYARQYGADELAKKPNQHIESLRLRVTARHGDVFVDLTGRLSGQGLAKRDGLGAQKFEQRAFCGSFTAGATCRVECDGGNMRLRKVTGDMLEIETTGMRLDVPAVRRDQGCGGVTDLAEGKGRSIYRLKRMPLAHCPGLE